MATQLIFHMLTKTDNIKASYNGILLSSVVRCFIYDTHEVGAGGAIRFISDTPECVLTVENCLIRHCSTEDWGGAIWCGHNATIHLTKTCFSSCTSIQGSQFLYIKIDRTGPKDPKAFIYDSSLIDSINEKSIVSNIFYTYKLDASGLNISSNSGDKYPVFRLYSHEKSSVSYCSFANNSLNQYGVCHISDADGVINYEVIFSHVNMIKNVDKGTKSALIYTNGGAIIKHVCFFFNDVRYTFKLSGSKINSDAKVIVDNCYFYQPCEISGSNPIITNKPNYKFINYIPYLNTGECENVEHYQLFSETCDNSYRSFISRFLLFSQILVCSC